MPFDNNYWDSLFGTIPTAVTPEPLGQSTAPSIGDSVPSFDNNYWDNLFTESIGNPNAASEYGMQMDAYEPGQELNSSGSFYDRVGSLVANRYLEAGKTVLEQGAWITDLLDNARKSISETWDTAGEVPTTDPTSPFSNPELPFFTTLGHHDKIDPDDPALASQLAAERRSADSSSILRAASKAMRGGANVLAEAHAVNRPQMEEGGSLIDELQASIGLRGYEGYNPIDIASTMWKNKSQIDPIEFASDLSANLAETAGGMVDMAIAGTMLSPAPVKKAKLALDAATDAAEMLLAKKAISESGDLIGTGMAMQTFADTYLSNTQSENDSRVLALATSAIGAGVQGQAEKIGWETGLGKGAVADLFKGIGDQSRLQTGILRGMFTSLTEGGEEVLQGFTDVLAKAGADVLSGGWDANRDKIVNDLVTQLPDQFVGGFSFGGFMGGSTGFFKLGIDDVDARHGGTAGQEDAKLADSINKGPASNDAKQVAVDAANNVVDSVDPLDLEPIEYERSDAFVGPLDKMETRRRNDKLRRLEKIALNSMAHKEAADQAIVDEVAEAESQRAEIANTLAEEDVTKIGTAMQNSVMKNGIEAESKVAQLHAMWQQFSAMMQGQAVQMDNPEAPEDASYSEPVMGMAVQITPGEAIAAMAEKAVELGVALPDALIADPDNFDWQSWGAQEKATAEGMAKAALAPSAKAITDAIPVDPAHPINSVISGLTEPPVASQRAPSAVLVAQQVKEATRQQKARAGENVATASPKWYVPNVLPAAHVHDENNLLDMIGPNKDLTEVDSNSVWGHIANKFGLENVVAAGVGNDIATYIRARNAIASGNVSKPTRDAMVNAVREIERKILMQQVPDFDGTVPDIEALSTHTASMAFKYEETAMSPGAQLNNEVAASDLENPDIATAIANENAAQVMVPWVKTALFNIWQTAPKDLQNRVAIAISGNPIHDPNLGRDVMRHLASHGMYKAAARRAEVDTDYAARIGLAIGGVGKGVMSPYAMKRVLVENGVTPDVADSTLAMMAAMATSWSRQNNASKFEFWDRMGDQVRLMNYAQSDVAGFARASSKRNSKMMSALVEGGRGLMSIFMGLDGSTVKVALHESIHSLFMSGLMWEMLDQQARDAMEEFAGEKLWGPDGEPLEISSKAHEMLAVGFEKFIYLNKAPTKAMEAAFKSVKEFIRDTIYHFLKSTGIIGAVFTDYEVRDMLTNHPENEQASGAYPAYQFDTTKVDLTWGDFKMGLATTRAYYQLLNTEFDGTEVKWIAPGVAKAYENRLAAVTGLPADGVVSQVAPASVITLPVFPKDRVVTAEDLPDAEEAARTKWFHGSRFIVPDKSLFSSLYSKSGEAGTGVYLTDDPKVAELYRNRYGVSDEGSVAALKVAPRKVLNLLKDYPKDVVDMLDTVVQPSIEKFIDMFGFSGDRDVELWADDLINEISKIKNGDGVSYLKYLATSRLGASAKIEHVLSAVFSDLEVELRKLGYDALTHPEVVHTTGGPINHSVLVLLDPQSEMDHEHKIVNGKLIGPVGYPKTIIEAWDTTNVDVDNIESGWQWDDGQAPTQDQWRTMAGLTNDESNGTHTQEAEFSMEANRVAVGELSKVIKENPATPATQQHITNKAVQASVAEEAPMLGSAEHDELMGTFYDQLLAGGKDIYNSGKLLDFSDMPSVKDMLSNFSSKMRRWAYEFDKGLLNGVKWVANDYMKGEMKDSVQPFIKIMRAFETRLGNVGAPWERMLSSLSGMTMQERERIVSSLGPNATEEQKKKALADKTNEYLQMNLPSWAMAFNNHFAISKLAEKVAELPPMIWNSMGTERIPIPGGKSYNRIIMDFTKLTDAFWAENKDRLPYRDVNEYNKAIQRDFRMYLLAARQKELEENVKDDMRKYEAALKKWEAQQATAKKKAKAESTDLALVMPEKIAKPAKPKLPKITEQGSHYAEAIMALLNSRYGKDVSMFTATAAELTQWENHMVLGKLLNANMINQKSYDDMVRKGKAHIPMYRLRAALEHSGARNVRLDASVYRPLDYLKNDISVSMEDPLNAMLRRAKAVMVLTERQHAKNAIGKRILADVKWWAIDNPNSKIGIFSDKVEITKDEWDELVAKDEKDRPYMITSEEVYKKTPMNTRIHKGFRYFKHVPFTSVQVEEGLKHVVASARRKKQLTAKQEQAIQDRVDHSLFAFYPEPGKAMYVYIADPELAEAFFYMNNPQAMFANSVKGQITNFIAGMKGADHQASVADRIAYETAKTLYTGYFGFQKVAKRMITSNLAFVTNVLARDLPQAMARSRHGLRLRDVPRAIQQSMASMFPSIAEINPDKYSAALDAERGMSTFSGLAASNSKGELDADVIFELMRGRSDREALAKHGSFKSKLQLMHNDFSQFLAKEGMNKSISQIKNELLRGENVFDNLVIVAKSPLMVPLSMFQALSTIMENTTRLAERGMTMSEDMSQYPTLAPKYDPAKAINGKLLAGFDGTSHRIAWEKAKAKLKVDPNYAVPEEALPKQFDAHQRDYAEINITLNFAQKGTWTQNIDDFSMFFNTMVQDFYTNAMIILQHSYLKKAVAQAMGETYVPSHNQPRLDEAAWRWMYKSIFYMTLPAIASVGIYGTGDDDDSLDWQAQSFIEKMSYYWIPVNKLAPSLFKRPIRMATGLGLASLIFHDLPMAGFLDATGRDNAAMKKWMDRFFDATPIGLVMNPIKAYQENGAVGAIQNIAGQSVMAPELVNPIMEVMADRDEFRNRGIKVNTAFDQREPAEIGSERYNILVNTIARNFNSSKLQPAQVDYMIRRYFPGALRAIPQLANKAMEMYTGAEGVPEDMMASNSPLARPVTGILPKVSTTPAWGMGNEFVRDLLSTAREAEEKMNTYEDLVETRKPQYMAQNKLIQPDIYWGRNGSGGLKNAAAWVINKDKEKRALLKAGAITPLEASMMEREYTLFAMHAMSNVLDQLGRN